jgi:hypothetical protein
MHPFGIPPLRFPFTRIAATNEEIKLVEKSLGAPLGLDFSGFLGCTNG